MNTLYICQLIGPLLRITRYHSIITYIVSGYKCFVNSFRQWGHKIFCKKYNNQCEITWSQELKSAAGRNFCASVSILVHQYPIWVKHATFLIGTAIASTDLRYQQVSCHTIWDTKQCPCHIKLYQIGWHKAWYVSKLILQYLCHDKNVASTHEMMHTQLTYIAWQHEMMHTYTKYTRNDAYSVDI